MLKSNMRFTFSILIVTLLICGFAACKSETGSGEPADYHLTNADIILSQYNADRPEWDYAERTEGRVVILVRKNKIVIEHNPPDSVNEQRIFFLQTKEERADLEQVAFKKAEVLFLDKHLIVNALDVKKTLHFYVENEDKPAYLKDIKGLKSYAGYGLGLRKINLSGNRANVPFCACDHASTPPGNCKAGGVLDLKCASATEDGSCRVACSGQYYACCDRGFE